MDDLTLTSGTNITLTKSGTNVSVNCPNLGTLANLETTTKTDVVSAINEINTNIGDIGAALDDLNGEVVN